MVVLQETNSANQHLSFVGDGVSRHEVFYLYHPFPSPLIPGRTIDTVVEVHEIINTILNGSVLEILEQFESSDVGLAPIRIPFP